VSDSTTHPCGVCECSDGTLTGCCHGTGPAAYRVEEGDKTLLVCTRCILSIHTKREILLTKETPAGPFLKFDFLGAASLALRFAVEQKEKNDDSA
jgi:hypothetical protein